MYIYQDHPRTQGGDEAKRAPSGSEWIIYLHTYQLQLFYCVNDQGK